MTGDEILKQVMQQIQKTVIGKEDAVKKVICAMLAGGHILIEDIPGLGKTTMAMAIAQALNLNEVRMQFTPDVLPSDILGFHMYDKENNGMVFHEGPIFCNLFLADEINRTSPKSQSALLEVMEEGSVTVDGETMMLEKPFHVIATQNPSGSAGTSLLPESQMDRFMICISLGYPSKSEEKQILKNKKKSSEKTDKSPLNKETFLAMQEQVRNVYIHDVIYDYMVSLVQATRNHKYLELGASPRGGVALSRMSCAAAYFEGRDYVTPDDVVYCFYDCLEHRILLNNQARMKHITKRDVLIDVLKQVPKPRVKS